jgi:hypothetical protein
MNGVEKLNRSSMNRLSLKELIGMNQLIDIVQDWARNAVDTIKNSSLLDEEKKNKIDVIEVSIDRIVNEIRKIITVERGEQ